VRACVRACVRVGGGGRGKGIGDQLLTRGKWQKTYGRPQFLSPKLNCELKPKIRQILRRLVAEDTFDATNANALPPMDAVAPALGSAGLIYQIFYKIFY
jgi:hypothetical protein